MQKISSLLKKTRIEKGFKIKGIAQDLRLNPKYLLLLESGDFNNNIARVYIIGYLRTYSKYLGLNSEKIIDYYKRNLDHSRRDAITDKNYFKAKPDMFNRGEKIVHTGKAFIMVSSVILVLVCSYLVKNNVQHQQVSDVIKDNLIERKYEKLGFEFKKDIHGEVFLLAKDSVILYVEENDNKKDKIALSFGQLYFVDGDSKKRITADKPELVDVYQSDDSEKLIGSLDKLYQSTI